MTVQKENASGQTTAQARVEALRREWRTANTVTDWEFAEIGALLCDNSARDLALMVVRLQGQVEVLKELAR